MWDETGAADVYISDPGEYIAGAIESNESLEGKTFTFTGSKFSGNTSQNRGGDGPQNDQKGTSSNGREPTFNISDLAPEMDFSSTWGKVRYFLNMGYFKGFHYTIEGKADGFAPIMGYPPEYIGGPLRKGQTAIRIGRYLFNPKYFHTVVKPQILEEAGDFAKIVGKNPDVGLKGAKIILKGAKSGPYVGKTLETELNILDFIH